MYCEDERVNVISILYLGMIKVVVEYQKCYKIHAA
jgi:hypothetical protein